MTVTIAFLRENLRTMLRPGTGVCGGAVMTSLTPCRGKRAWCPVLFDNRAKGFQVAYFYLLSRLQLASANRVAALTSRDGILWVQGIPDVKKRYQESTENAYYRLNKGCRRDKFVTDVLRTQSRFVKCVGGFGLRPQPPQILQTYFGPEVRQKQTL